MEKTFALPCCDLLLNGHDGVIVPPAMSYNKDFDYFEAVGFTYAAAVPAERYDNAATSNNAGYFFFQIAPKR